MPIINLGSNFNGIRTITYENAYTKEPYPDKASSTPTALSAARSALAATSVGNYALFGGGASRESGSGYRSVVDAYNASLTRSTPAALSTGRTGLAATSVGNYALFGGGNIYNSSRSSGDPSGAVDAYNTSLTHSTPTALSVARRDLAATSVGNYALFGGGYITDNVTNSAAVNAYNTSLTRSTTTVLSAARRELAATSVGNYALFGGGSNKSNVDAYNTSLTRSTPTALSVARRELAATSVGNYALFGGGSSDAVDAYNTSLTRSIPTALSAARSELVATSIGNYALFGGGVVSTYNYSAVVDDYNTSLTRSIPTALSAARSALAATSVGNYALFGGGASRESVDGYNDYNVVDAYTLSDYALSVTIPPFSKYKFTESSEQKTANSEVSKTYTNASGGISGYIIVNGNTTLNGDVS